MADRFTPDDKLVLTNLNKVFWPEHGYTKKDLLDYYRTIAPVNLPYLIDRPQVLCRWPFGQGVLPARLANDTKVADDD